MPSLQTFIKIINEYLTMIRSKQNIDPVIRDLNNYLAAQDQHDIQREIFQAKAEKAFQELNYLEIIEYQDNYTDLEMLFEFVVSGKMEEAKSALNNFFETVKDAFIENTISEFEKEEQKERDTDDYMERCFIENGYPRWY